MLQCLACQGKLTESEFVEYKDRIYSASSRQAECPYCGSPYSPLRIAQKDFLSKGLSGDLMRMISCTLIDTGVLENDRSTRALFEDKRISFLRYRVPEASSAHSRASLLISFLSRQQHVNYGNGLVLFLEVVGDAYADAQFYELASVVAEALYV